VGEHEAMCEEHLVEVPQARLVTQPPEDEQG
jgi:hypothetical protein